MDPNHPLLSFALHCLKDRDTERPSADELCGRLATLKGEQMYTHSVEQSREQSVSVQMLQQQVRAKERELERARANHETELQEYSHKIQQKSDELERARENHQTELREYSRKTEAKTAEYEQVLKENSELHQKLQQPEGLPHQDPTQVRSVYIYMKWGQSTNVHDNHRLISLVPRPSSTFTFGGPAWYAKSNF